MPGPQRQTDASISPPELGRQIGNCLAGAPWLAVRLRDTACDHAHVTPLTVTFTKAPLRFVAARVGATRRTSGSVIVPAASRHDPRPGAGPR